MVRLLCFVLLAFTSMLGSAQVQFNDWFLPKALRIDYFLAGDYQKQNIYLDGLREEPYWSGSPNGLIDLSDYGSYKVEVTDKASGKLLYSRGFCTLFQEWQSTDEAKLTPKAFEQVTRIPYPKNPVIVEFKARNWEGVFTSLYRLEVDTRSLYISRELPSVYPVTEIVKNGAPEKMLDITFIAEGYTVKQMEKFRGDVRRLYDYLVSQEPFDKYKDKINVWAVESPSEQEGPDNPGKRIWNKTPVGSSFYTFGVDRYLTTLKFKSVMDIAANAPGDQVYILINSNEYGGGGVYNHYNVSTSDHFLSTKVLVHEFGHGLAGLGDEYIDSSLENFYNKAIEPWEPNLTTLVNFDSKWKGLVDKGITIPTLYSSDNKGKVGAFEGAGYVNQGIYRSMMDCRMRTNEAKGFCKVCADAIDKVMQFYVK